MALDIAPAPSDLRAIATTGNSANRVDIIFLGDGYTASQIATTYTAHIQDYLNYIFDDSALTQPFGRYQNFFNIYAIDVVSSQSGADDPARGIFRNTALDATYRWDGVTDRLLYVSDTKAQAAMSSALAGSGIGTEMRYVLVNDTTYGGGGGYFGVYAAGNSSARDIALHEIGHSFVGLADEYDDTNPNASSTYSGAEPGQANVTKSSTGAKWSEWLGYNDPVLGLVGAYEGGLYNDFGIYRPTFDSKMRSLGRPFDPIAREEFIHRFYQFVNPLDGFDNNVGTKFNVHTISVDVIDPAVILVDWSVNGQLFTNMGETFSLVGNGFFAGSYTVTARAYDPTDWVRGNRSDLEQTVAWTIVNNIQNASPTAVALTNTTASLIESTSTATRIKVADIVVTDDGIGSNTLGVTGADAIFFETDGNALFLKAGTVLDFESRTSYSVAVTVDDTSIGSTPDATSATYTLQVTNAIEGPEIAVSGNGLNIADGDLLPDTADGTSFGAVGVGSVATRTFSVTNLGDSTLTISKLKMPKGFVLTEGLSAAIAAGATDTFTVGIDTKKAGTKSGQITFTTNDANEAAYNFALSGNVVVIPPEIEMRGNGTLIADNDLTPQTADGTAFGDVLVGSTVIQTFTVSNSGAGTLTLSKLKMPKGFVLVEGLSASIAPGASDAFQVRVDTKKIGVKTGQITFTTNDPDETPFNFALSANVLAAVNMTTSAPASLDGVLPGGDKAFVFDLSAAVFALPPDDRSLNHDLSPIVRQDFDLV